MTILTPVRAESLSAQVAETIREAIFRGELMPSQVLRELGLARKLNVSQATIREALSQLEHYGLVLRTPNRSTSVTNLSPYEVHDRLRCRMVLSCLAFCDAAKNANPEDYAELDHTIQELGKAVEAGDAFDTMKADQRFHQKVWGLSGNPILFRTLDQLTMPLFAFLSIYRTVTPSDGSKVRETRKLLDTMRDGDNDRIIAAVREHIEGSYRTFLSTIPAELNTLVPKELQYHES